MKSIYLTIALLAVTACGQQIPSTQAVVNLDYASTSLGYRNSGALSTGRLMIWDKTGTNELVTIATDIDMPKKTPTTPTRLEASSVRGSTVSASLKLSIKANAQIANTIKNNLSFVVTDAVRVDNRKIYSAISKAYTDLKAEGVDAYKAWRIEDIVTAPDRYKFVLLRDEVQASDETINYDNSVSGGASFNVIDEVNGNINVSVPATTTARCSGTNVVCYVNASVLTVGLNDDRNLDYSPSGFNKAALSQALRQLN